MSGGVNLWLGMTAWSPMLHDGPSLKHMVPPAWGPVNRLLATPLTCKWWAYRQACMQLSMATRATYMQVVDIQTSMHAAQHCYTSHIHASSGQIDKHACSSALPHEPRAYKQWADGQAYMQLSIATRATYMQVAGRYTIMHAAQQCYTSHIRAMAKSRLTGPHTWGTIFL